MSASRPTTADRGAILKRLLITLVCMIFFEVTALLVQLTVIFQYGYLLIAKKRSEPLRQFSNTLAQFGYRLMRYNTLNENKRPFPFNRFPEESECEPPEKQVLFK
ncbi:Glucose-1-phosphate thymidylyltransferase, long form [Pseudodesulfovibrio profundus]|uniref:Glucose-1-phosphate thymidylyltransferase, long form n=1 Tax=Pseudodesulfovibrio profundus TaxID=57320 RepID=A0A2C8FAB9_9BACT|nr:DUF4389 domain-containing protein [Pseudodesulfovibrio profundus]MBC15993.1 glucose-1-phosphate thymidylyltransferase [Desulfovibrio sp.]SOB59383.1 Glucose-1-phosphate thymidylyltransferase, long form [Pseudodesulfovibrio profundus]|tara:strand:+ start:427 stop:741 length:315 start_codon:yes stop_codon:yes gene_type:complete